MLRFPHAKTRFCCALLWFAAVQAVQISWMASWEYMGPLIFAVYAFLLFGMGVQFGLASLFFSPEKELSWPRCLQIAGSWVFLEWGRHYFLTGFAWNPIGLAFGASHYALQFASLFGVYGLSFWAMLTNLAALKALCSKQSQWARSAAVWVAAACLPYLFGGAQQIWVERWLPEGKVLDVALVQTGLLPEEREYFSERAAAFIPPLDQWERVFSFLDKSKKTDLIVLPEAAFPFGARRAIYDADAARAIWKRHFGEEAMKDLPYAALSRHPARPARVNNAFFAQALANRFGSHVILGMDDQDPVQRKKYNAAFHFRPGGLRPGRTEKRILIPVSEYLPFHNWSWFSEFVAGQFGIGDSFDPGTEPKIFQAAVPIGVSICVEETYGELIRQLRLNGAELLVNVTNDVWFPGRQLPLHHFEHARIRSVENGVFAIRACNTGVTGGIDCFGRPLEDGSQKEGPGVVYLSFPIRSFRTLYTFWGDRGILTVSFLSCLLPLYCRKKKLP